jgi:hypothetical protein
VKLINFIENYPSEDSCRMQFKELRISQGVICKKCKNRNHYWLESKQQFQCKKCMFRTTLRSGTVMQWSKLSFRDWFICIHLISAIKKSVSARELQRQLKRNRYQPIWEMMHKIRLMMGDKNDSEQLSQLFELSIAKITCLRGKKKNLGQTSPPTIAIDGSHKLRLYSADYLLDPDHDRSYCKLSCLMFSKRRVPSEAISSGNPPRSTNKVVLNLNRMIVSVHHLVSKKYFQNYLDEFCYKFIRRYSLGDLFFTMLKDSVHTGYA